MKKAAQDGAEVKGARAAIALDVPRVITLKGKHGVYLFHTRRVTQKDWEDHFQSIVNEDERVDGKRSKIFDPDTALVKLADAVTVRVEGYGDLAGIKNWRERLPIGHRMAVGLALRTAAADESSSIPAPAAEQISIRLACTWPVDGATQAFSDLVHRFRAPGIEHLHRFNRGCAAVEVKGDGKNSITAYPARGIIAMKLYDELIESVEGYTVGGAPLEGVEAIRREMDGAHKSAAALELFAAGGDDAVLG